VTRKNDEITDETLMLYLDGELSREEGRDVERALERPELQARMEALTQLRDVVRARSAAVEEDAEPMLATMWERMRPSLGSVAAPARVGVWSRVRDWFESYRSHMMTGAVAAAAGALVAGYLVGGAGGARTVPTTMAAAEAAEVDSLEVYGGSGTVFHFPDDKSSEGTTVVWVTQNEDPDDDGDAAGGGGPI
jgi:anti-sigma factor RsiW